MLVDCSTTLFLVFTSGVSPLHAAACGVIARGRQMERERRRQTMEATTSATTSKPAQSPATTATAKGVDHGDVGSDSLEICRWRQSMF